MKINKYYDLHRKARFVVVCVACVLIILTAIKSHSHTLEMDYAGPGSEYERTEREARDKENREAHDRVCDGATGPRDIERSIEYERDHGA